MIATASFVVFALAFVGGALAAVLTRRPSVAGLGLVIAMLGGSGLCVLLDEAGLALGVGAASLATIATIYSVLVKNLSSAGTVLRARRRSFWVLAGFAVGVALLQIFLAIFGLNVLPDDLTAVQDIATPSVSLSEGLTSLGIGFLLITALLVFTGFVASLSILEQAKDPAKDSRLVSSHRFNFSGRGQ